MIDFSLERFVARVDERAAQIEPRRVLVAAVALPFYVIGFLAGAIIRIAWVAGVYLASAAAVGYETGRARGGE